MTLAPIQRLLVVVSIVLCSMAAAAADWQTVAEGVDYREYRREGMHAHVTRVDLSQPHLNVLATRESRKGAVVSEFARRNDAIVAINGDYFDPEMRPVGHAKGPGGSWKHRQGTRNQPVIGFARGRAEIFRPKSRDAKLPPWVRNAVSGWPMVVENCRAIPGTELPGSDFFTRAPHPRTAVGLSEDRRTLYLLVADGRREGVPGLTLEELGTFMRDELGACSALNLDGGGSTAMAIEGRIVNQPSDGPERPVANHLAVVDSRR